MNRREFLGASAAAAAGVMLSSLARGQATPQPSQPVSANPRWRGFNLTELTGGQRRHFVASDFEWLQEWGFNFARFPLSYWLWSKPKDWLKIDEEAFRLVDEGVELGRRHGIHINLCLHRIPGYCVNGREAEPHQLFEGSRESMDLAVQAAAHHWRFLARRYKDRPSSELSFDLLNEPPFSPDQTRYVEVAKALITAIREVSPDRLIIADGADLGQSPIPGLADLGIIQSTRGYLPKMVSHYTATWVPAAEFESTEKPTWPMTDAHGVRWDREKLRAELITKWQPLQARGVPIHVGEWGCFSNTPHDVCLAWMSDLLSLWKEVGWGWSMWNLRGPFGPLDSGRSDVAYENFRGHKLDRKMLELLLAN